MAKKEKGFYHENTVEVTHPNGTKHRVFKGDAENVKKAFAKAAKKPVEGKK